MASQVRTAGKSGPSLVQHRLFPVLVALWFAALFAAASLAVPAGLVEQGVAALALDRIVPAAAPPLGMTARVLVALGLGAAGATAGLILASLAARSARRPRRAKTTDLAPGEGASLPAPHEPVREAPARRPILAIEELDAPLLEPAAESAAEVSAPAEALPALTDEQELYADPAIVAAEPAAPSAREPASAADRLLAAPLESLSHVELIERLAISLQSRRQQAALSAAAGEGVAVPLPRLSMSSRPVMTLSPLGSELDDGEDEVGEEEYDSAEVREDGYSSLLDMGRLTGLREDFIPIGEEDEEPAADDEGYEDEAYGARADEPVVIFPGAAMTKPYAPHTESGAGEDREAVAERLRSALHTLRRAGDAA